LIQKISIVIRVAESPWLELHALRHTHLFYLIVDDAHRLLLHPLHLIAVQAILAVAVDPTLHPRSKARTVPLIAFSLLASTEYLLCFFYHLVSPVISIVLQGNALLAAEILIAEFLCCVEAGAVLEPALEVAEANMLYFWSFFIRKPLVFGVNGIDG
jgi:hypothetical protein